MKIDDKKFEALKNKQEQEKNQALAEIYSEEAFERSPGNAKAIEERSIAHEEIRQVSTATRQENEIWSVDDLAPKNVTTQKEIEKITPVREVRNNEPLPNIRQVNMEEAVQIPFTERLFAHLPMRESQLKEAPHPRLRELAKKIGPVSSELSRKTPRILRARFGSRIKETTSCRLRITWLPFQLTRQR